jgi:hypothetical protein
VKRVRTAAIAFGSLALVGLAGAMLQPHHGWRSLGRRMERALVRAARAATETTPITHPAGVPVDVRVTLRCDLPRHPISPLIYGIGVLPLHDGPESHEWRLGATARRWGGNHTSRYNWENGHAWNTGKDWFFENVDDGTPNATPLDVRFVDDDLAHGLATALTVPTLGWVAKDSRSYSFPVAVFGAQQATAPENADIGNGVRPDGTPVTPGGPERTSTALAPESVERWVRSIVARQASDGRRRVQMYILDNEPTLWSETHRDVHPRAVSYDELLERTVSYASAIRRADPGAVIAGPALWGWPAYFHSGIDQAAHPAQPDQDAHEGLPLLPWWLRETARYEKRTGTRVADVVDVHFYPQGHGIGIGASGDTDPDTNARRLRATRALWDPSYVDESWIAEPVRLVPRIREWIAKYHPGLGLSIGEYNFGAEGSMSGGLAVAEALGRFGVLGLTAAYYWDYPADRSPAFWAFRAFRDFDGHGARFLDESVVSETAEPLVSVFASGEGGGGHFVAVVLNRDPGAPMRADLNASTCGHLVETRAYSYTGGGGGLAPTPTDALDGQGHLRRTLPPYSITVLDLQRRTGP